MGKKYDESKMNVMNNFGFLNLLHSFRSDHSRIFFLSFLFLLLGFFLQAQNSVQLRLDSCYALARMNYPLIRQLGLIEKTRDYNIENAGRGYLPQFSINGLASNQSAVTSFPFTSIDIPHVIDIAFPTYYTEQYNIHGEVNQILYDGGAIKQQKLSAGANADVDKQNVEVQLYSLRDRINQIFFGTLLIDEQLKQNEVQQKDIQNSIDKMSEAVRNGTALQSSLDELQAELLQQQQNHIDIVTNRNAYINMLSVFINRKLEDSAFLEMPSGIAISDSIRRPELSLYASEKKSYDIQDAILNTSNRPKLSFYFQGGYARPGLNVFDPNAAPYWIGGFRLSWNFSGYYTLKNQRQALNVDRQIIDLQQEAFILNSHISMKQQGITILKLQEIITKDDEIIAKRTSIKESSRAQMENGTVTVHEYVGELDAEDQAKLNRLLHGVQLLQAEYNYQNTIGKP